MRLCIGPLGNILSLETLPARNTKRWSSRRKAEVIVAVEGALLSFEDACERYDLTLEEFATWQRAVRRSGLRGLRVSKLQLYKALYVRQQF